MAADEWSNSTWKSFPAKTRLRIQLEKSFPPSGFGSILSVSGRFYRVLDRFYPVSGRLYQFRIDSIHFGSILSGFGSILIHQNRHRPTNEPSPRQSSFIGSGEYAAILINIIIGTSTRDDVVGTGIVVDILGARRPIRVCLSACFPDYAAISSIITINTATTTKIVSS